VFLDRSERSATIGVAFSVCLSVGLSVCNDREPCKMAKPIETPFGMWTRVDPRNYVLDGVEMPHGKGHF